jgi:hypothetical protein
VSRTERRLNAVERRLDRLQGSKRKRWAPTPEEMAALMRTISANLVGMDPDADWENMSEDDIRLARAARHKLDTHWSAETSQAAQLFEARIERLAKRLGDVKTAPVTVVVEEPPALPAPPKQKLLPPAKAPDLMPPPAPGRRWAELLDMSGGGESDWQDPAVPRSGRRGRFGW